MLLFHPQGLDKKYVRQNSRFMGSLRRLDVVKKPSSLCPNPKSAIAAGPGFHAMEFRHRGCHSLGKVYGSPEMENQMEKNVDN